MRARFSVGDASASQYRRSGDQILDLPVQSRSRSLSQPVLVFPRKRLSDRKIADRPSRRPVDMKAEVAGLKTPKHSARSLSGYEVVTLERESNALVVVVLSSHTQ